MKTRVELDPQVANFLRSLAPDPRKDGETMKIPQYSLQYMNILSKGNQVWFCAMRIIAAFMMKPALAAGLGYIAIVGLAASAAPGSFVLVDQGQARVALYVASEPSPSARLAVRELQNFIEGITGTKLPIISRAGLAGIRIAIPGTVSNQPFWTTAAKELKLKRYEHLVRITESGILLLGHDSMENSRQDIDYTKATGSTGAVERISLPGMFEDQGTLRATYDFLERCCGVRFYGPGAISVLYPKTPTLSVSYQEVRREPSIPHISGSLTWRWPLMNGQYGQPSDDALRLYERRLRLGGIPWYANHTLHRYPNRFPKDQKPEFYDPTGSGKLCYSSTALAWQVAQDARDYFAGKEIPDLTLPKGSDYYPVVPEDAATFCRCSQCRLSLDGHTQDLPRTPKGRAIFNDGRASHLWFGFVNQIARELKKTHPDKYLSTLAYESYYWYPTEFKLEPNIAIVPCMQVRNYWHMTAYVNELGHYSRWVSDQRPVFLWNYYCFPEEPAVIQKWHCFPGFSAHELAKLAKRFARDGVLGTFFCGIGEQVDFYLTAKLYDDALQDVDTILNEFFRLYFGKAAQPMQAFYTLIEATYSNPAHWDQNGNHHQNEEIAWKVLGTEERMEKLGAFMNEAERLAETPGEKARVNLWKIGVWDYMVKGRQAYLQKSK